MNLYDLTGEAYALQEMLESPDATQEEKEDALQRFAMVKDDIETKLNGYYKVIKNFKADVKELTEEINKLQAKKKAAENNIERLRDSVLSAIEASGQEKVKTTLGTFSIKMNKTLITHFEEEGAYDQIPAEFLTPQDPKVDKKGLKQYLLDNPKVILDCAEIVTEPSLIIR